MTYYPCKRWTVDNSLAYVLENPDLWPRARSSTLRRLFHSIVLSYPSRTQGPTKEQFISHGIALLREAGKHGKHSIDGEIEAYLAKNPEVRQLDPPSNYHSAFVSVVKRDEGLLFVGEAMDPDGCSVGSQWHGTVFQTGRDGKPVPKMSPEDWVGIDLFERFDFMVLPKRLSDIEHKPVYEIVRPSLVLLYVATWHTAVYCHSVLNSSCGRLPVGLQPSPTIPRGAQLIVTPTSRMLDQLDALGRLIQKYDHFHHDAYAPTLFPGPFEPKPNETVDYDSVDPDDDNPFEYGLVFPTWGKRWFIQTTFLMRTDSEDKCTFLTTHRPWTFGSSQQYWFEYVQSNRPMVPVPDPKRRLPMNRHVASEFRSSAVRVKYGKDTVPFSDLNASDQEPPESESLTPKRIYRGLPEVGAEQQEPLPQPRGPSPSSSPRGEDEQEVPNEKAGDNDQVIVETQGDHSQMVVETGRDNDQVTDQTTLTSIGTDVSTVAKPYSQADDEDEDDDDEDDEDEDDEDGLTPAKLPRYFNDGPVKHLDEQEGEEHDDDGDRAMLMSSGNGVPFETPEDEDSPTIAKSNSHADDGLVENMINVESHDSMSQSPVSSRPVSASNRLRFPNSSGRMATRTSPRFTDPSLQPGV